MNGRPHRESNQGEYALRPSKFSRNVDAQRALAPNIVGFGNHLSIKPLPQYMRFVSGDLGRFRHNIHQETPVVPGRHAHGYRGEAWLRMQPFYTRRHPSGLPDSALLRTPADVTRGRI